MLLLIFAAGSPVTQNVEDLSISIAKVVGIIAAVAIGSWTTARKLQSIEDAIADGKHDRKVLFGQMRDVKKLIQNLTCSRAGYCPRRKAVKKGKR